MKLLYFWAEWCEPCKVLSPIVDELKSEGYNVEKVEQMDITPEQAATYHIMSVPTMVFLEETGEIENITNSVMTKQQIISKLTPERS